MKSLLVTGPIGGGKSFVCRMLQRCGVPVYDCDGRAKEVYVRHPGLLDRMETDLGMSLRTEDGALDRAKLAQRIFSDPQARRRVNALVHPLVVQDMDEWQNGQSAPLVAFESALFLSPEAGASRPFDAVWYVDAPQEVRLQRILGRDACTTQQAQARVDAQALSPDDPRVDLVLHNDSGETALARQVADALRQLDPQTDYRKISTII